MDASSATTMALRVSSSSSSSSSSSASFKPNKSLPFKFTTFRPPPQPTLFKSLKCIQTPPSSNPNPLKHPPPPPQNPISASPFSCSALTLSPSTSSQTVEFVPLKLQTLISKFQSLSEQIDRVKRLVHYAALLPPFNDSGRVDSNRVMGCTARVWLQVDMDEEGKMRFATDSDSEITRGFCSCLVSVLDGASPEEVLGVKIDDLSSLNVGLSGAQRSRVNTWHNVLVTMQKKTKALVAQRYGTLPFEPFPSLVVTVDGIQAKGSFAEA